MLENLSSSQQADVQAKQKIVFILKLLGEFLSNFSLSNHFSHNLYSLSLAKYLYGSYGTSIIVR